MKILVLGTGAREHGLVRHFAQDPMVSQVLAAPGNPGMGTLAQVHDVDVKNNQDVVRLARQEDVDLVVVGPEAPLVAGVADELAAAGVRCFGPTRAAAMLEGSKTFAKEVMEAAGVPTAKAYTCTTTEEADKALAEFGATYVVKDDGLDAGKGVVVTDDLATAQAHVVKCLAKPSGAVVIEEYLDGPEFSVFCFSDGTSVRALPPAQDFKRIDDGDKGLNTGGMGAYSPLPWAKQDLAAETIATVATPVIDEMRRRGTPFVGILYCGLALTADGIKVIEFNARLGDPDGYVALSRLKTGLGAVAVACVDGTLAEMPEWDVDDRAAVTVVMSSEGYPVKPVTGRAIVGDLADAADSWVMHAGTSVDADGALVTSGGRVLGVMGFGASVAEARSTAYARLGSISFEGAHWRTDIAAHQG